MVVPDTLVELPQKSLSNKGISFVVSLILQETYVGFAFDGCL
jgi:hypothetical protein